MSVASHGPRWPPVRRVEGLRGPKQQEAYSGHRLCGPMEGAAVAPRMDLHLPRSRDLWDL